VSGQQTAESLSPLTLETVGCTGYQKRTLTWTGPRGVTPFKLRQKDQPYRREDGGMTSKTIEHGLAPQQGTKGPQERGSLPLQSSSFPQHCQGLKLRRTVFLYFWHVERLNKYKIERRYTCKTPVGWPTPTKYRGTNCHKNMTRESPEEGGGKHIIDWSRAPKPTRAGGGVQNGMSSLQKLRFPLISRSLEGGGEKDT